MKRLVTAYLLLLFIGTVSAQQTPPNAPHGCGTHQYSPWLEWYHQNKHELADERNNDTSWLYVPVTVHLVGTDEGTSYYNESEVFRIICELNEQYVPVKVRFYFSPNDAFRYHAKTKWYDHDWSGGAELINTTRIDDRLNCYIVADPAGNCGYSWYDAIVMGSGCSDPGNSTWAHEAGHHFSLPHPFYGWEDRTWDYAESAPTVLEGYAVEKMDGSNCTISGDRFCDTRPDYLNYRWSCNNEGLSTVVQKDPNGVEFRSDATLYMSYSLDACSGRFSDEQIEAIRTNLMTEHASYLVVSEPGVGLVDATVKLNSPIDSAHVQYNNIELKWYPIPNARFYQIEVSNSPYFSVLFHSILVRDVNSVTLNKNIPNNRLMYWRVRAFNEWDVCASNNAMQTGVFRTKNLSATNDLERVADISLTPNPVVGGQDAVLSFNSSENFEVLLTMHDASGRLCLQKYTEMYSGENYLPIPTNHIEAGLYFVTIQTPKGSLVKKLVITE